jgi:hypothetical protein
MKLVLKEEDRMASQPGYRTPARTLRKLAAGPMIFELDKTTSGDWDRFQVRNIGISVTKRMGLKFGGDVQKFRQQAVEELSRALDTGAVTWRNNELPALSDLAVALSLVEDLASWSAAERRALAQVIQAKSTSDESRYLSVMQKHRRLRAAMIELGSR